MEQQTQQSTIPIRKKKRNYWKIMFLTIVVVLFILSTYLLLKEFEERTYNLGANDGVKSLIQTQNQQGVYYYFSNHTGNITIEVKSLQEICGGGQ